MSRPTRPVPLAALAVTLVLAACGSRDERSREKGLEAVARARAAQAELAVADARDHDVLAAWLQGATARGAPAWPAWRSAALERIAQDRSGYQALSDALQEVRAAHAASGNAAEREQLTQRMGSVPLRAELGRLLGSDKGLPGLLTEAAALLDATPDAPSLFGQPTAGHASAVRKVAGIYAALATQRGSTLASLAPPLARSLTLAYPVPVPEAFAGHASSLGLAGLGEGGEPVLLFPNAGYVFGGVPQGSVNRGMECGAFVSWVHRLRMAWWSGGLEAVALARQAGKLPEDAPDWLKSGWGTFELVAREAPLRPGDIVVWRWDADDGERVGHVALCIETPDDAASFLGLETCRLDDGSREGIVERRHALHVPGRTTWVLRVR
ncbi:MAG: CHAP domain-containing protein [Planctomycetota bacterium]